MKNKYILLGLFLILTSNSFAIIRNVPGAYSSINAAISASTNGDTILVQPGTYSENINFRGKKVVLTSKFYMNNDYSFINNTIINGSSPVNSDTASCVIFKSGEDSTTVLQGFTITGGNGTKWTDIHGAGVYREGGGILIELSSPVIRFNIIRNNTATNSSGVSGAGGGGIRIGDGNPQILNNIIVFNQGGYGPGIVLNYTGVVIRNNIIASNTGGQSFYGGSGIWAYNNLGSSPKLIENNSFVNNTAVSNTGGILAWSTTLTLKNNILWNNTGSSNVQLFTVSGIINASYCDVQGGYTGTGNINVYPAFADSNYILSASSPCIDAGDSSNIYLDPPNPSNPLLAKYPSRGTRRNDIGAYGGPLSSFLSSAQIIGIKNNRENIPENYALHQNYPNPFNPSTQISYDIPKNGFVSLKVYDLTGKEIVTLINGYHIAGSYMTNWTTGNISSGVYFYKLFSGNFSDTKKMLLIR